MKAHLLSSVRIVLRVGAFLYAFSMLKIAWDARLIVPFFDEWDFIAWYKEVDEASVTLVGLWAAHNGHRLLVPRLLFLLRDSLLGGEPGFLVVLSLALQAGLIAIIVSIIGREPQLRGTVLQAVIAAAAMVLLTWTVQMENFHWDIQVAYVLSAFLGVSSIALLACLPRHTNVDRPAVAACGIALLACLCLGAGLGAWPALMAVAIAQRRGRQSITFIAAGCAVCATFFLGTGLTALTTVLADPVNALRFLCRYLGPPYIRESYAVLLGGGMIGLGVLVIGTELRSGVTGRLASLALGLVTFGLSVALLTTAARSGEALAYNRYVAFSTIYWVGLLATAGLLATTIFGQPVRWVLSAAVLAVLIRFPLATATVAARPFLDRADQSTAAVLSMLAGTPDEEEIAAHLYPRPQVPVQLQPFLAQRGYGFFGGRLARAIGDPVTDAFQLGNQVCGATISVAMRGAGVRLSGSFDGATQTAWLVVVDRAGRIRGLAARARDGSGFTGYVPTDALGGTLYGVQGDTLCSAASLGATALDETSKAKVQASGLRAGPGIRPDVLGLEPRPEDSEPTGNRVVEPIAVAPLRRQEP